MRLEWDKVAQRASSSTLTVEEEQFARLVAGGIPQCIAYQEAFKTNSKYSDTKAADPRIKLRIKEIREAVMKDTEFDVAQVLKSFMDVYDEEREW